MYRTGAATNGRERRPLHVGMIHLSDFRFDSRVQRQARALAERGDVVELVCLGEADEYRVGDGIIRIHPVAAEKPAGGARHYLRSYIRFLVSAGRRLTALELRSRFDVVQVHNMPDALTLAAFVPKMRGARVVLDLHDTFPELFASKYGKPYDGWGVRVLELEERLSARLADRLLCVTNEARLRLAERGVGAGRTEIVMNSPDEGAFGPQRQPRSLPPDGELRVLYHGGTARRFGVETVIQAFERLSATTPRVSLRVCGPGDELPRLRELAARIAPDRIDIAGPVPFETIPAELAAAHIGVVPTLYDRFTELLLPVKLLEYIHSGLPVVASRLPGITTYFTEDDVRMFEPGQPESLARAIEDLCADPVASIERARRASERLEGLAWERGRAHYLEMIDQLVALPKSVGGIAGAVGSLRAAA